jgi:hypothetical protein
LTVSRASLPDVAHFSVRGEGNVDVASTVVAVLRYDQSAPQGSGLGVGNEVSDPSEELLLLDPSVFLGAGGFGWLEDVPHDERRRFVVPRTFFLQILGLAEYTVADEELWGPLPNAAERRQLAELLAALTRFSDGDAVAPGDLLPEVVEVADHLRRMGSQVAVEEWLYLHSNSSLGARSRKILQHFKRAGAKVVELAGSGVDGLTWLALGKKANTPTPLTTELRVRAGINVVVVGGMATVAFFLPWLAIPGAIVGFLINPYLQPAPSTPVPP